MKGELLGRYQIEQQLGKRAGRRTLLARDSQTQELVVVKLLSFSSDFEWEDLKLFQREAETLKSLTHPAIPRYLDYFELKSSEYKGFALVQTYVEGKSLEEHLKAGRTFSEADIKQIATAILEILNYLHSRQPPVIHRDIKPSNILLTNRSGNSVGEVYLVDFGSVQTLAAKEGGTITVVGTYGYMPPEQFGGRAVPASDLYSLGATLIYLATGQHPADLPQTDDLQIEFEKAANLSPAFINWLKRMTHPSLNRRLNSAQQALQTLEQEQLTKDSVTLAVKKPTGSKFLLTKNADYLEIIFPPLKLAIHLNTEWKCLTMSCSLFILVCAILAFFPFFGIYSFIMLLPFLFFEMCLLLPFVSLSLLRTGLRIDRHKISYICKLIRFKIEFNVAETEDISRLEHTKKYLTRESNIKQVEVNSHVTIWAGI